MKDRSEAYDWREDALCGQTDPEAFFPEKGGNPGGDAKRICALCGVQPECLEYALTTGQDEGVWGGFTAHELKRMRRAAAA